MHQISTFITRALLGVLLSSLPALPVRATSLLDGKTITTEFHFPSMGTIGFGGVAVDSVVGPGVEIAASPQSFAIATIDFSDTSILLTFTRTLDGSTGSFNGWRFFDSTGTIAAFTSATFVTDSVNTGWSIAAVDADNIWLNGQGSHYVSGTTLRIDIVPEPATGLLGVGVLAFAVCAARGVRVG